MDLYPRSRPLIPVYSSIPTSGFVCPDVGIFFFSRKREKEAVHFCIVLPSVECSVLLLGVVLKWYDRVTKT